MDVMQKSLEEIKKEVQEVKVNSKENMQVSAAPAVGKFTKPVPINGNSKQKASVLEKIEEEKKNDDDGKEED